MKAAINAKNFLNMLKRVINFYWKKTLPPYPHEPPKNHFESEKNPKTWLIEGTWRSVMTSVEKCFEKNPKLKKTNWFYMLQENSICWSHIIFYFFNFKGGVPYFIFLVPLIISKCRFMLKRRFPKLIIMKYG